MSTVTVTMTIDQAAAMTRMLDLAMRIHILQFREIAYIARMGELRHASGRHLTVDQCDALDGVLVAAKAIFGFESNASFGIHSQHVSKDAHRGYEIEKVIKKALAEHRDPKPEFRGVDYDGIIVRLTDDPVPVAVISSKDRA